MCLLTWQDLLNVFISHISSIHHIQLSYYNCHLDFERKFWKNRLFLVELFVSCCILVFHPITLTSELITNHVFDLVLTRSTINIVKRLNQLSLTNEQISRKFKIYFIIHEDGPHSSKINLTKIL